MPSTMAAIISNEVLTMVKEIPDLNAIVLDTDYYFQTRIEARKFCKRLGYNTSYVIDNSKENPNVEIGKRWKVDIRKFKGSKFEPCSKNREVTIIPPKATKSIIGAYIKRKLRHLFEK